MSIDYGESSAECTLAVARILLLLATALDIVYISEGCEHVKPLKTERSVSNVMPQSFRRLLPYNALATQ